MTTLSASALSCATPVIGGLHYFEHLFNLSDEEVARRWVGNPYRQQFCGETYFRHQMPIHPRSMPRWRKRIGEESSEWLLTKEIEVGRESAVHSDKDCRG